MTMYSIPMGNRHKTGKGSRKVMAWNASVFLSEELPLLSLILYYACAPNERADSLIVGNWNLLQENLQKHAIRKGATNARRT